MITMHGFLVVSDERYIYWSCCFRLKDKKAAIGYVYEDSTKEQEEEEEEDSDDSEEDIETLDLGIDSQNC